VMSYEEIGTLKHLTKASTASGPRIPSWQTRKGEARRATGMEPFPTAWCALLCVATVVFPFSLGTGAVCTRDGGTSEGMAVKRQHMMVFLVPRAASVM
jgi:hypothetical protein